MAEGHGVDRWIDVPLVRHADRIRLRTSLMTKPISSLVARFTVAYALLGCLMVWAKFVEQQQSADSAFYSLLANLLGLILLLPWIVIFPGGRLGQGVNTPFSFLAFGTLNLAILIAAYVAMRMLERRRQAK